MQSNIHKIFYSRSLGLKKMFLIFFLSATLFPFDPLLASDSNINTVISDSFLDKIPSGEYIIGEGDFLGLIVSRDIPELNGSYKVDSNGTIYVPKLNRIYVSGLTINELNRLLNERYKKFVKYPRVEVEILGYRPIRVYLKGQIEFPGLYTLPGEFDPGNYQNQNNLPFSDNGNISNNDSSRSSNNDPISSSITNSIYPNNVRFFPTVFDAIKMSGGLTLNSDISDINIKRVNSYSNGGGKIQTTVNFKKLLFDDQLFQNIRIYDGDIINVGYVKDPILNQITQAIQSNLNPRFVNVHVSGRVENPGLITVSKTSSLNDAIELAGGTKALKGKVFFTRFNQDGTIIREKFNYSTKNKAGSKFNPYIKGGDIIRIGKSPYNIFNEVVGEFSSPFVGIYSFYGLFRN